MPLDFGTDGVHHAPGESCRHKPPLKGTLVLIEIVPIKLLGSQDMNNRSKLTHLEPPPPPLKGQTLKKTNGTQTGKTSLRVSARVSSCVCDADDLRAKNKNSF